MFTNTATFACLPRTTRGSPLVLGGDPKGKNFLYANGNSIIIRDIDNPNICDIYTEHSTLTTVAKYSPSGFYIASADQHGKVRIWDTTQKEHILKNEFQPFVGTIKDLAWSADNQRMVVVGEGRERFGHVFAVDTGTSIGEIAGHSKIINSCDFKPSRPFKIVTGSEDNFVGIYEGPPFKFKSQIQDHSRFVQAIRFSPSGDHFASAGFDGKLFIYNSSDNAKITELGSPAHKGGIYAISWSPDGKQILSASGDKTCKIWDVASSSVVTEFILGSDVLDQQVSCLWQGDHILSVSLSGFINYLDKNNPGRPLRVIKGHNKSITALAVSDTVDSAGDKQLITGSHDGCITLWSVKSGDHDRVGGPQHTNQIQDMAAKNDLVYTCALDDTLKAIDMKTGQFSSDFGSVKLPVQPRGLAPLKNSNDIVVAGVSELLVVSGSQVKSSLKINYESTSVDVSPDEKEVAVGGMDNKVHIYSLSDGKFSESKSLALRGGVMAVKYSPSGAYLATADANRKTTLFKTRDHSLAHDFEWGFHTARVNCLAWSPSSSVLVSGGLDTNLIAWFPAEPSKHSMLKHAHPQSQVTRVAFVSENVVVSTGQDATVRTWSIQQK